MNKKFKKIVATGLAASTIVTGGLAVRNFQKNNKQPKFNEYTIESGDTLFDISNRYYGTGIYYDEIAEYNHIDNPDEIKAGDVIRIPNITVDMTQEEVVDQTYTIQQGDNLINICNRFYGDSSYETALKLAEYNNIENPDNIRVGQEINIPSYDVLIANQIKR